MSIAKMGAVFSPSTATPQVSGVEPSAVSLVPPNTAVSGQTCGYDFSTIVDCQRYCKDRLADVKRINQANGCQTPSAFITILTLAAFLSTIVCPGAAGKASCQGSLRTSCKTKSNNTDIRDGDQYCCFLKTWMPRYAPFAEDIYSIARCGLVHRMSPTTGKTHSHSFCFSHNAKKDHLTSTSSGDVILDAFAMIDDLDVAVGNIFSGNIGSTIFVNFKNNPPIRQLQ